jgi:AcrR family transcriptional regulator
VAGAGRPAKFDRDELLDAALALVAEGGPAALTLAALARAAGAPSGSIYHRFASLDALTTELWVRTVERFQQGFVEAVAIEDSLEAMVAAALYTSRWSRRHLAEARLLLLHRHRDLVRRAPPELARRLEAQRAASMRVFRALVRRHFGRATSRNMAVAWFAVVDVPYGAVRRALLAGKRPPPRVDQLVEQTCRALLAR